MKTFRFKESRDEFLDLDAQKVGSELLTIDKLTPKRVVDFARQNPKSEAYKAITWDDSQAAYRHRLNEARELIRALVVVEEDGSIFQENVKVSIPAFEKSLDSEGVEIYKVTIRTAEDLKGSLVKAATPPRNKPDAAALLGHIFSQLSEVKMTVLTHRKEIDELLSGSEEFLGHIMKAQEEVLKVVKAPVGPRQH